MNTASGACLGSASTITVEDRTPTIISVPYRFARAEVEARATALRRPEIFHKGERIAVHIRASGNRKHTDRSRAYMPSEPPGAMPAGRSERHPGRRPQDPAPRPRRSASRSSSSRPHPEQGLIAPGLRHQDVRLAGSFGRPRRLEGRRRAGHLRSAPEDLRLRSNPSSTTSSIGGRRPRRPADTAPILHPNVRGPALLPLGRRQLAQTSNASISFSHARPLWNGQGLRRSRRRRPGEGPGPR